MWGFGVEENIWGRGQTVDITDDLTGEPHKMARRSLPMYVNEVGHSDLEETVHACEDNGRVIKYFVVIRKPMTKGDELELFVNYRSAYESNRERKGYGKNKEKGDDHFPSRLRRNFPEREHLILDVEEAKMCDFAMVVEFCATLAQPLHALLDSFLLDASRCVSPVSPVSAKQVVAVRRLDWISSVFKARLDKSRKPSDRLAYEVGPLDEHYTFQCHENLPSTVWGKWPELLLILHKNALVHDKDGNVIWDELCREAMEEICFEVCQKIVLPFDESRWCPIAIEVTHKLCVAAAESLWSREESSSLEALSRQFLTIAKKAADEINGPVTLVRLAFDKDFQDLFVFDEPGSEKIVREGERIVVTKRNYPAVGQASDNNVSAELIGRWEPLSDSGDQRQVIHKTWYLARQVFFLVDSIAQFALEGESTYSRDRLLETIGLDSQTASLALDKAVLPRRGWRSDDKHYPRHKSAKERKHKPEKVGAAIAPKAKATQTPEQRGISTFFWAIVWHALKDEHGWTLIHGNRPNDFYACPPGVIRGQNGFRNRIHYFDSVPLSKLDVTVVRKYDRKCSCHSKI
jgi:hypothetical protein